MKNRFALFGIVIALLLGGCGSQAEELKSFDVQYLEYFDTISSITIYAPNEEKFEEYREIVQSNLEHYHQLFDTYNTYDGMNNIKTINDNAGLAPVAVDGEIIDLLQFATEEYDETGGKVNVAMGGVLALWHDYREWATADPKWDRIPETFELERAATYADIHQVVIDETAGTVYLPDSNMRLDVGAIAKGYSTQRISDKLREAGVTSALLSLGGNVETIGAKGDGTPWRVGVQDPSGQSSYVHVIRLEDTCLVTSGTYQRYFEVDGVRYHHIIHPELLHPWNEYDSVTILCEDSGVADALSTAVFNMDLEEGQAFIESLEDTEALWIMPDGSEVRSSGFEQFMEE